MRGRWRWRLPLGWAALHQHHHHRHQCLDRCQAGNPPTKQGNLQQHLWEGARPPRHRRQYWEVVSPPLPMTRCRRPQPEEVDNLQESWNSHRHRLREFRHLHPCHLVASHLGQSRHFSRLVHSWEPVGILQRPHRQLRQRRPKTGLPLLRRMCPPLHHCRLWVTALLLDFHHHRRHQVQLNKKVKKLTKKAEPADHQPCKALMSLKR